MDGPQTVGRTDRRTDRPTYRRLDWLMVMYFYSCRLETKNLDCKRNAWNWILLLLVQQPIRATYGRIDGLTGRRTKRRMDRRTDTCSNRFAPLRLNGKINAWNRIFLPLFQRRNQSANQSANIMAMDQWQQRFHSRRREELRIYRSKWHRFVDFMPDFESQTRIPRYIFSNAACSKSPSYTYKPTKKTCAPLKNSYLVISSRPTGQLLIMVWKHNQEKP